MIRIPKNYDSITMNTKAFDDQGRLHELHGTWAIGPFLSWYDRTDQRWLQDNEWSWTT